MTRASDLRDLWDGIVLAIYLLIALAFLRRKR